MRILDGLRAREISDKPAGNDSRTASDDPKVTQSQHTRRQDGGADDAPRARGHKLPHVCGFFLGLGIYRAWIEVCFVGSFVSYPGTYPLRNVFDLTCAAVLFACAAASRRLSPLCERRWVPWTSAALMTLAGALGFACLWLPSLLGFASVAAPVMGGAGLALTILLWSELYGCLSPVRIALYYALSQLTGAAVIWTLRGFALPWLAAYTCALPAVSVALVYASYGRLARERRPRRVTARFSFPWKPALFVSVYAFAFGLQEASTYALTGPHSGPGMAACALVVVVGITLLSRQVDFGTIYSLWLPVIMMVSLLMSLVASFGATGASFFVGASYAAAEIFIMTMMGSVVYRYGANALWLFGIERGVRMLAMLLGRNVAGLAHGWPVTAIVLVAACVATVFVVTEGRLTSSWGVELADAGDEERETAEHARLGTACARLGRERGLTQRECEVLLMLAQRKTAGDIERELCVAYGTAKAHIRHVYRKLDIHSREELFELVGVAGGEGASGGEGTAGA